MRGIARKTTGSRHVGFCDGCFHCDVTRLAPSLMDKFFPLVAGPETEEFVSSCIRRASLWRSLGASLVKRLGIMTHTDANAKFDHGHMFVLGTSQVKMLLHDLVDEAKPSLSILDIGAGNGNITEQFRLAFPDCSTITTIEVSPSMTAVLRSRGYKSFLVPRDSSSRMVEYLSSSESSQDDFRPESFDLIVTFNVLDRCEDPIQLLEDIHQLLKPNGLLCLAVVFPFRASVETSDSNWRLPSRDISSSLRSGSWESYVEALRTRLLEPSGFIIERFSRAPYMSESETSHWLADHADLVETLDDVVIVCRKTDRFPRAENAVLHPGNAVLHPGNAVLPSPQ